MSFSPDGATHSTVTSDTSDDEMNHFDETSSVTDSSSPTTDDSGGGTTRDNTLLVLGAVMVELLAKRAENDMKARVKVSKMAVLCDLMGSTPKVGYDPCEICVICCEENNPALVTALCECTHRYCTTCITKYVEGEYERMLYPRPPRCPHPGCGAIATRDSIMAATGIDATVFKTKFDNNPLMRKCAGPKCGAQLTISFNSPILTCEECGSSTCAKCSRVWLGDEKESTGGEESGGEKVSSVHHQCFDDTRNDQWMQDIKNNVGFCPHCFTLIEKNGGCAHMMCLFCGRDFQWLLAEPPLPPQPYVRRSTRVWRRVCRSTRAARNAVADIVVIPATAVKDGITSGISSIGAWLAEREARRNQRRTIKNLMRQHKIHRQRGSFGPVNHEHLYSGSISF